MPVRSSSRRLAIVLGALSTFGPLSMDMYLPGLPALARELHATASTAQLTITACLLGLGTGQLVTGPLSDAWGRRRLLLVAVALYAVTSLACTAAPDAATLCVLRFLQGLAGGGGLVIARAVVRDLFSGATAARYYSALMMASGLAPILAPLAGGAVLRFTDWRGVFVVLAVVGAALTAAAFAGLPETLPAERRRPAGVRHTAASARGLLADPSFLGFACAVSLAFGGLAAYLAGSSFVLEGIYGTTPQVYAALFACNAGGILIASQLNRRLLRRFEPIQMLVWGLTTMAVGGCTVLAGVTIAAAGLPVLVAGLFIAVSSIGLIAPNATALALTNHADAAGTGSAVIGFFQFLLGAVVAPLIGVAGVRTAVPMALVLAALGAGGLLLLLYLRRTERLVTRVPATPG